MRLVGGICAIKLLFAHKKNKSIVVKSEYKNKLKKR